MKKYTAIFWASLLVCGALILPTLHEAGLCSPHNECSAAADPHRDHEHEGNAPDSGQNDQESDNCAICQLAATPTIANCSTIQITPPSLTVMPLLLANSPTPSRLHSGTLHARAPPALPSI